MKLHSVNPAALFVATISCQGIGAWLDSLWWPIKWLILTAVFGFAIIGYCAVDKRSGLFKQG